MSDRLALTNAIEDAGIERAKAERIASVVFDAIHEHVASRNDVLDVRNEVVRVRAELTLAKAELTSRIDLVEHRLMTRLGGLMVVLSGLLFGALHLWPTH